MRRLLRAIATYVGSCLTWRTCWRHAKDEQHFHVVARDGFRYIEPRQPRTSDSRCGQIPRRATPWPPPTAPRIVIEDRVPQDVQ